MKITDSHVHFWNPSLLHYDWIQDEAGLNRPFLPSDFRAASSGMDVNGLIFVQADCREAEGLEEVKWVSALAAEVPIQGIVAFAPLEQGDRVRHTLDALKAYPLVKGVRRLIQSEGAGFATQSTFVQGVKALAEYGYCFDICVRHHQLADAIKLVSLCPDVSFILDHVGKPNIAAGEMADWKANIRALAEHPHVWCKLSGMMTEASPTTRTLDHLRPYVEHVLEDFTSRRVMFGSDWPVCTLVTTYAQWVEAVQVLLTGLPAPEQTRIFSDNAREFYEL